MRNVIYGDVVNKGKKRKYTCVELDQKSYRCNVRIFGGERFTPQDYVHLLPEDVSLLPYVAKVATITQESISVSWCMKRLLYKADNIVYRVSEIPHCDTSIFPPALSLDQVDHPLVKTY